jgi:ElaB/YqjD/DUF883 family membrane-anchored ribosome-binding protein
MTTAAEYAVREHWDQIKGKILKHWGLLTEDDVEASNGSLQVLVGRIHDRTGRDVAQIERDLDKILETEVTSYDQIRGKFNEYTEEAAATAKEYGQQAKQYGEQAMHTAQEYAQQAGAAVEQGYNQAAEYATETYHEAEQTIRRNPMESVMVCFGSGLITGVLVGLMLRGRR